MTDAHNKDPRMSNSVAEFSIIDLPDGRQLATWPRETTVWHWPDGSLAAARTRVSEAFIAPASEEDRARGVMFQINETRSTPVDVSATDLADILDGGTDMLTDLAAKATLIEALEARLEAVTGERAELGKQVASLTEQVESQKAGIPVIEARFEAEKERLESIARSANETSAGLVKQLELANARADALAAENEALIAERQPQVTDAQSGAEPASA